MKIIDIQLFLYSIPFKRPYRIHDRTVDHREGAIIKLTNRHQTCGYGEIAPLPELNSETLNDAVKQFLVAKPKLLEHDIPDDAQQLNGGLNNFLEQFHLPPSVLYGLEMAILNLIANQQNCKVNELLSDRRVDKIPICALLQNNTTDIFKEVENYCNEGYHALKVKVGNLPIEEEIKRIQKIDQIIQGKTLLRLDANRKWDIAKAVTFGNEVGLAAVEYIEEPLADLKKSEEFFMKTTIPIAADESLREFSFEELKSLPGIDVLVLKPLALGGVEKVWKLFQDAKGLALKPIISSSFESGLGVSFLANIAGCSTAPYPAGLDTLKWFEVDVLKNPPEVVKGSMTIPAPVKFDDELNFDILTPVN